MAKKTTKKGKSPSTQFESARYGSFAAWQKVFFWIGVLSFLNLSYWIVRLVIYLVLKERPLRERVDAYALQTLVFGVITAAVIALVLLALAFIIPIAVVMHQ